MRPAGVAFCLALAAPALAEEAAADEGDKPAELDSVRSALGVARSFDKLGSILPPAAGVGLRLKASKAHRVNASLLLHRPGLPTSGKSMLGLRRRPDHRAYAPVL